MEETATVTSKSMINIPAAVRRRYGIREGDKVVFLDTTKGPLLVRVPPLMEIYGSGKEYKDALLKIVKELEEEHRREAAEWA